MTTITPSVPPGFYAANQAVSFTFSPDVTKVAVTTNKAPPSISKYIAYDQLQPPNPFLAVIEDGAGRVAYDGGFMKFMNFGNPSNPGSMNDLNTAGKLLCNSMKWLANTDKIAKGIYKILVLGDTVSGVYGDVKMAATDAGGGVGFRSTIQGTANVAGFSVTFMNLDDFGGANGKLDVSLAQLEQYCSVFIFSANNGTVPLITQRCVNDLVTFRENGNGVFVASQRGYNLNSIDDVDLPQQAYFKTANAVISKFGAYMTGSYDRNAVPVGYIRQTYGDHPLYFGMADAERLQAGSGEAMVIAPPVTLYDPNAVPVQIADHNGQNTINVLVKLSDGTLATARFVYIVQGSEFVFVQSTNPASGQVETNSGNVYSDPGGKVSATINIDGSNLGTVWGEILRNGKRVGEVLYSNGTTKNYWFAGAVSNTPWIFGDNFDLSVKIPFNYGSHATTVQPHVARRGERWTMARKVQSYGDLIGALGTSMGTIMKKVFDYFAPYFAPSIRMKRASVAEQVLWIDALMVGNAQTVDGLIAPIYQTTAALQAAIAAATPTPGVIFIDGSTTKVYGYATGNVIQEVVGLKPHDFFGGWRTVTSSVDGAGWRINQDVDRTMTKIS